MNALTIELNPDDVRAFAERMIERDGLEEPRDVVERASVTFLTLIMEELATDPDYCRRNFGYRWNEALRTH